LGDVQEVALARGDPARAVVEPHGPLEHVERLGDGAVEWGGGPGLRVAEGPPVEAVVAAGAVAGGEVLAGAAGAVGELGLGVVAAQPGARLAPLAAVDVGRVGPVQAVGEG